MFTDGLSMDKNMSVKWLLIKFINGQPQIRR